MAFQTWCIVLLLPLYCHGNDIVAVIEQDVYNIHFRTFYLSVGGPDVNVSGAVYPTYTGVYDQLHGVCSYLTQRTLAVFIVGNRDSINFISMVTDVLGIPTLAYLKDSKTVYQKRENKLLLVLGHSYQETARAVLTFFKTNFWFRFLIIVEDTALHDRFFGEVISLNHTELWTISLLVVSKKMTPEGLHRQLYNHLAEDTIVLLHLDPPMAVLIFKSLPCNTSKKVRWFITEKGYTQNTLLIKLYPIGSLVMVPDSVTSLDDVISDSVSYLNSAIQSAPHDDKVSRGVGQSCMNGAYRHHTTGLKLYRHFQEKVYQGFSMKFEFNSDGYLANKNYRIKALKGVVGRSIWEDVGYVHGEIARPRGILWPSEPDLDIRNGRVRYRVVTNPVKPFVMVENGIEDSNQCIQSTPCIQILVSDENQTLNVLHNYENINDSSSFQLKCCRGFAVDLLNKLASDLEFEYVLYIVHDTTYGKEKNGTWDGMMRDLTNGIAHMAIAAFSITGNRLRAIDFSYPYYFSRFTVLYTQQSQKTYMYAFLEPFSPEVWCTIFVSASLSALGMSMFEWNSPFGLNPWGRKRKQNYTIGSGMTMVYSLLFGHTVSTKSPKSWPSKVLQNFWASACIFIIASYTANLAAFLAGKHNGIDYNSVFDSRLMEIRVGVLGGSAVEALTNNINKKLYQRSQHYLVPTTNDAINMLINGNIDAYLGDYPILDYARVKLDPNCNLYIVPQSFGEDEYGIGFPKDSPLQKPVSEKIKHYHESGYLENLIDIHFDEEKCFNQGINQQRFSLTVFHHSGLFALLSIAIVCCILLVIVEHLVFKFLLPICRGRPDDSFWKSLNVMFFSQRLHRCINSAVLVSAQESAKEMLGIVKKGDFSRLFMKSTIRKNKLADMAKTKRINRNFLDIVEKAKWVNEMKSTSLFPDDSPDEPVDITRLSLRNLSNCVNLEALRSQYQHSLPKVDSVRDYDDSGEECNESEADDIQTLRGLEDLCDIQASDSKYDMWYVPGKLAADDNQELEYCDKRDVHSSYEGQHLLSRCESGCSSGTASDETLGACYRGENEAACYSGEKEAACYRGEKKAACYRGENGAADYGGENEAACYGGENEASFCEVSQVACQLSSKDGSASFAKNRQCYSDDESDDEKSGLLTWDRNRGHSSRSARSSTSERYRPHSMQSSPREHNKTRARGLHALNHATAQPLNVASMSKQELLHLWKSSELQLNYLLQNTLRENIELKKSLSKLRKRPIKDTAV